MIRVAIFPDAARLEPCGRASLLARALAARGHLPILVGATGHLDDNALLQGGEVARYELDASQLAAALERWDEVDEDLGDLFARDLAADLEALDRLAPDAVLVDGRPTTCLAAELAGLPCVSVVEAARWPHLLEPPGDAEVEGLIAPSVRRTAAQLRVDGPWTRELRLRLPAALRERLAALGAGGDRAHVDELLRGDAHLLVEHPGVVALREAPLPPDVHTVGPLLFDVEVRPPWFWSRLSEERPLVTVFLDEGPRPIATSVWLETLAGLDAQLVVVSPTRPPGLPGLLWCRHLPLGAALRRSDLVVCTGQSRVAHAALLAATPLVVVSHDLPSALGSLGLARRGLAPVVSWSQAFEPSFVALLGAQLAAAPPRRAPRLVTDPQRSLGACAGVIEELVRVVP